MLKQRMTQGKTAHMHPDRFQVELICVAPRRLGFGAVCLVSLAMVVGGCASKEAKGDGEVRLPDDTGTPPVEVAPNVEVEMSHSTATLTPLESETYSERSTLFTLRVSGDEVHNAELDIAPFNGLSFEVASRFAAGTKTFDVTVLYDGKTEIPGGAATVHLHLRNVPESHSAHTTRIAIMDGRRRNRPIPVNRDNIMQFNLYANTTDGLKRHYELTEDVVLPLPPHDESNWTPIGDRWSPGSFSGSFDGKGFTITGLTIHNFHRPGYGLFGGTTADVVIENLGLIGVRASSTRRWDDERIGGLVGFNGGTLRNCYVTGSVTGVNYVGGLVGHNGGTVENCSFTGSVTGSFRYIGGLVGVNSGTVKSCYVMGSVTETHDRDNGGTCRDTDTNIDGGYGFVGGVAGGNSGTVENCYVASTVTGCNNIGGVVGRNVTGNIGSVVGQNNSGNAKVQNCYAAGSVTGNSRVGGVVGWNHHAATVQNTMALNPNVAATGTNIGRVVGRNVDQNNANPGTLSNNFAFVGMTGRNWDNIAANNLGGANRTASELHTASGFPEELRSGPWTYAPGSLPGLFGETVDMPNHIPAN